MIRRQLCITFSLLVLIHPSTSEWRSTAVDCVGIPDGETPEYQGNASVILDEILGAISSYLRESNVTEISIPDQEADFDLVSHGNYGSSPGLKGHISLANGTLSGYDKIKRIGDAKILYLNKGTNGSAAVRFDDASFFYKMNASVGVSAVPGKFKSNGTITASLKGVSMRINMSVNLLSLCKKIDGVSVENLDSIRVQVNSGWLLDRLSSVITNTVISIYKQRLVPVIEAQTADAIQTFLNNIDLDDVLRPPSDGLSVEHFNWTAP